MLERSGLVACGRAARWRPCRLDAAPIEPVAIWTGGDRRFRQESFDRLEKPLAALD